MDAGFIARLESAIEARQAQQVGPHLRFICPAHDDHNPSADWHRTKHTWRCRACNVGGGALDLARRLGVDLPERRDTTRPAAPAPQQKRRAIAAYSYVDEAGQLLYQSIRFEPKSFSQRRPDGNGGWIWNVTEVRKVPYNLPGILAGADEPWNQPIVYVVEGEKDADRLNSLGCVATTNVAGAGKWTDDLSAFLSDRNVVILPDNDDAGRQHAQRVLASLDGIAASARIIELPGLREKGDVSDWLDAGGTVAGIEQLIYDAERAEAAGQLQLLTSEELLSLPRPNWIVEDVLVEDSVACIVGPPGTYKSFIALSLHYCIASGMDWYGRSTVSGPSLYLIAEGVRGMSSRVAAWRGFTKRPLPAQARFVAEPLQLANGATDRMLDAIDRWGQKPRLIIVDTLARTAIGLEENSAKDMGEYVAAADRIRRETGACVLFIHHSTRAASNPRGSSALDGAFDTLISVTEDAGLINVRCSKQKDAGEFHQFKLKPEIQRLDNGESSVVLIPAMMGEDINRSARIAYDLLRNTFGQIGATASEWREVVIRDGRMAEATFFRARKALVEGERVVQESTGRGARYYPAGQVRMMRGAD